MADHATTAHSADLKDLITDFRDAGFPPVMDRRNAAKLLGVSPDSLWKMTRNGEIPATRYGTGKGVLRYSLRDLAAYILNNRTS